MSLDGRVSERIKNYTNFCDVINGYYDGATELYEYGWSQSFHFSRFYKGEAFAQSLARHEHYLAAQMKLKPGMLVLDVGCGVGGPARELVRFADVRIIGLNNNDFQIARARKYTKRAGLEDRLSFQVGDFMKLSEIFGEATFDAVYAIEATVHAPSFEGVYGEVLKVLKPGGTFGVYEWVMTPQWNPSIPHHKAIAHGIEIGDGIPLKAVGFEVKHHEDLADRPDEVPWYYPLEGDILKAQTVWDYFTVWRMSWSGKVVTQGAVKILEWVGIAPKGTYDVGEALKVAAGALVAGGKLKIFTPMFLVISNRPA